MAQEQQPKSEDEARRARNMQIAEQFLDLSVLALQSAQSVLLAEVVLTFGPDMDASELDTGDRTDLGELARLVRNVHDALLIVEHPYCE